MKEDNVYNDNTPFSARPTEVSAQYKTKILLQAVPGAGVSAMNELLRLPIIRTSDFAQCQSRAHFDSTDNVQDLSAILSAWHSTTRRALIVNHLWVPNFSWNVFVPDIVAYYPNQQEYADLLETDLSYLKHSYTKNYLLECNGFINRAVNNGAYSRALQIELSQTERLCNMQHLISLLDFFYVTGESYWFRVKNNQKPLQQDLKTRRNGRPQRDAARRMLQDRTRNSKS
jgi:hypothetical protein